MPVVHKSLCPVVLWCWWLQNWDGKGKWELQWCGFFCWIDSLLVLGAFPLSQVTHVQSTDGILIYPCPLLRWHQHILQGIIGMWKPQGRGPLLDTVPPSHNIRLLWPPAPGTCSYSCSFPFLWATFLSLEIIFSYLKETINLRAF